MLPNTHIKINCKHIVEILKGVQTPPTTVEADTPKRLEAVSLDDYERGSWLSEAFHPPKTPF